MNRKIVKVWIYIIVIGLFLWIFYVSTGIITRSRESWFAIIFGIILGWVAIVQYRIYRKTNLISGLFLSIGSSLILIGYCLILIISRLLIPSRSYTELRYIITLIIVVLAVISVGLLLIFISISLIITKDSGGLKELGKSTTRIQRIFGNVSTCDLKGFPPKTKRRVATRIGLGFFLGALVFLFLGFLSYFTTGWFGYEFIPATIGLTVMALILIVCSFRYLKP